VKTRSAETWRKLSRKSSKSCRGSAAGPEKWFCQHSLIKDRYVTIRSMYMLVRRNYFSKKGNNSAFVKRSCISIHMYPIINPSLSHCIPMFSPFNSHFCCPSCSCCSAKVLPKAFDDHHPCLASKDIRQLRALEGKLRWYCVFCWRWNVPCKIDSFNEFPYVQWSSTGGKIGGFVLKVLASSSFLYHSDWNHSHEG